MRTLGLTLALCVGGASGTAASTIAAATCSNTDVQAAITSASDGDTVTIPATSCTWTTMVTIPNTKGITLTGAGVGQTIITSGTSGSVTVLQITVATGRAVVNVSNITFDANLTTGTGDGMQILVQGEGLDRFRLHHLSVINIRQRGIEIYPGNGGAELSGLIDHVTFTATGNFSAQGVSVVGAGAEVDAPMARAYTPGTNKSVYIEDCTFTWAFQNDSAYDAYAGARYVARYNTISNGLIGHHGADSGGYRGVHTFEIYRNTLSNSLANIRLAHIRSGSGVMFDNTFTGAYTELGLANYRSRPESFVAKYGQCDGAQAWDVNVGTGTLPTGNPGWPCLDQVGYVFTDSSGGSYTPHYFYAWTNTDDGVEVPPTPVETATYLVANRDFYSKNASFTGTTGVGVGTLASRPATCTPYVGYWATDQGTWNASGTNGLLYQCSATNTWTLAYTPYQYPHPLQGVTTTTVYRMRFKR